MVADGYGCATAQIKIKILNFLYIIVNDPSWPTIPDFQSGRKPILNFSNRNLDMGRSIYNLGHLRIIEAELDA